jgi:glucosyl-3-phosphoglycerate synthase
MSEFFQPGVITTLHKLREDGGGRLESDLKSFRPYRPVGLVLPALYSEFATPAMKVICDELRAVDYLGRIVVAIGKCSYQEYVSARAFFDGFRTPVTAIWVEDPRIEGLLDLLKDEGVRIGEYGKGRTCWLSYGYLLATGDVDVIALHDCDILNYSRQMLNRLVYPVAHPNLGFEFSKAYYARIADRMHGRVTRLFFSPIVRAIQSMTPEIPYLRFLDSFRYALSGEFAMDADLARVNRIPSDWGLEVGVLSEIYRNCAMGRVCQVDIADNYEHKHQELSPEDSARGLRRMTCDIAKHLYRTLAEQGTVLTTDHYRTLEVLYTRFAEDTVRRFYADSVINGLEFDLHQENLALQAFALSIRDAAHEFTTDPMSIPQISNWNRVLSAIPDFYSRLLKATSDMQVPGTGQAR